MENKKDLRKKFLKIRTDLSDSFRQSADVAICNFLEKMLIEKDVKNICAFISDGKEPSLNDFIKIIIKNNIELLLPRYNSNSKCYDICRLKNYPDDLIMGKYNILEPNFQSEIINSSEVEMWLVPGVIFDKSGGRMGRGKGIYDRLLSNSKGEKIGIYYECQKVTKVPMERHDSFLETIVTENGIVGVHDLSCVEKSL